MNKQQSLLITEIFYSLQGEALTVGVPTTFVRLTGCPLRCRYCDTEYAFSGGERMSFDDIMRQVKGNDTKYVTVTGGEPLAQKPCIEFLRHLCDAGFHVSLETSGALDVSEVDARVIRVMDIKTPASGEAPKNRLANIDCLGDRDQVKFVICDEADYTWSRRFVEEHRLAAKCEVLFSPSYGQLGAPALADWILRDHLPVRMQVQLHKILWGDQQGR